MLSAVTGFQSIILRELLAGARQKATQRARLFAGAATIGLFMVVLLFQNMPVQFLGQQLFGVVYGLLFLQSLLVGIRLTADCLSEEKREGTLGLLYLSGLRGGEIVLGKMAARSLRAFYAMLATLPVFGFCVLLGGVQGRDGLQAAAGLISTMLFSLAIGVFVSARATDEKAAFAGSIALLAAFCIVPNVLAWTILSIDPKAAWASVFAWFSPIHVGVNEFWKPLFCQAGLTLALLVWSAFSLDRAFKKQFTLAPRAQVALPASCSPRAAGLLEANPFLWLLRSDRFSPRIAKVYLVAAVIAAAAVCFAASQTRGPGATNMGGAVILFAFHFAFKTLVAADALRRLHQDHRSGALELLLTTPLEPAQILRGQVANTFQLFFPSAIALAIANIGWLLTSDGWNQLWLLPAGAIFFIFMDTVALRWSAMLQAFKPARFPAAVLSLMTRVVAIPVILFWLSLIGSRGFSSVEFNTAVFIWFVACGIYDAILIARAKKKLRDIRLLASSEPLPAQKKTKPLPKFLQWLIMAETSEPAKPTTA